MTAVYDVPQGWTVYAEVGANDSTVKLHSQPVIARIITHTRQLRAPGWPTAGVSGLLIYRPALVRTTRANGVRVDPLSEQRT